MASISGIGGGGMGISIGGAGGMAGGSGAPAADSIGSQSPGAGVPESLQSLVETMKDFSSAEILIALMMAGGGGDKDDKKKGGGSAAGAFLAGMAMAGMMGQQSHLNLQVNVPFPGSGSPGGVGGVGGGAGLSLNVSI